MSGAVTDKIVLGVDLDEVVFGYISGFRDWLRESLDLDIPEQTPDTWSLCDSGWFATEEEFHRIHGEAVNAGLYENLKVLSGAKKHLRQLSMSGYDINIITSRFVNPGQHKRVVSQTVAALDANHIPYNNLAFLSNKTLMLADAYIDDSPNNIKRLHDAGRFVIAFDMPYNQGLQASARATNWDEVRAILTEKFGQ